MKLRVGAGEARAAQRDPTLLCCAYNRQRLYLFTRREPEDTEDAAAGRCAHVIACLNDLQVALTLSELLTSHPAIT